MRRSFFKGVLGVLLVAAIACGYCYVHWVGYPHEVEGQWVSPRVMKWYWTGMPGWPYPGEIQYGYSAADGRFLHHGPYLRRVWAPTYSGDMSHPSYHIAIDENGYYTEGQKNGIFTKYQTYWGKPMMQEQYKRGKLFHQAFLESVPK